MVDNVDDGALEVRIVVKPLIYGKDQYHCRVYSIVKVGGQYHHITTDHFHKPPRKRILMRHLLTPRKGTLRRALLRAVLLKYHRTGTLLLEPTDHRSPRQQRPRLSTITNSKSILLLHSIKYAPGRKTIIQSALFYSFSRMPRSEAIASLSMKYILALHVDSDGNNTHLPQK